jgi:hypothetical protein
MNRETVNWRLVNREGVIKRVELKNGEIRSGE